jgi:Ca2+-binding EF-hand superfamily protein
LAQSLSLSASEEAEIREAYELFPGSVHQAFTALGITPSEEMMDVLEPDDDEGEVPWERFLEVAALARKHGDVDEEVEDTFRLFTEGEKITLQDLRRVMEELKEQLSEQQLRDMMEEAKGPGGKVDL